jgi:succinoglycan biosynthesis protein ExoO
VSKISVPPQVSFAVASYNSRAFLEQAVRSALAQRGVEVEVLIVDDHSRDGSDEIGRALALMDPRIRYFRTSANSGPSGARNLALAEACGEWFAILDSDDLIHPDRSARLLAEAMSSGADMIADDLLLFDDARKGEPSLFLDARRGGGPSWIGLADYLDETRMFGPRPNLGFLKPMIRSSFLRDNAISYDEALRIAEDDALAIRCLRSGARYRLLPQPLYFYRKHGASISHKLGTGPADAMMAANSRLLEELAVEARDVASAMARRASAMRRAWAFTHMIAALKQRQPGAALRRLTATPGLLRLAHQPVAARLRRLFPAVQGEMPQAAGPAALVISKQRLAGASSGSSAYLLAIARELAERGLAVHLVHPSDSMFGRTPFLRIRPEQAVFAQVHCAAAWRIGDRLIARSPRIWAGALRGTVSRVLGRAGLGKLLPDRKAPYSVATPWRREDYAAVARLAGLRPVLAVADYAFCAEAFACLADPAMPTAIVMHDQFSARAQQFGAGGDSVAALSEAEEAAMLASADAVLAIQPEEQAFVRRVAPEVAALYVPMPAAAAEIPAEGDGSQLLFVGSNTAPNIHGLRWFLDEVWPRLSKGRPDLRLLVAGGVGSAFPQVPGGVDLLGIVPDLAPLYRKAGAVISPLRQGSGLKIKLVEALAQGKACVVTGVTLQGVETPVGDAVVRADEPADFAEAILMLSRDPAMRRALGEKALNAARKEFGPAKSFSDLNAWLDRRVFSATQR